MKHGRTWIALALALAVSAPAWADPAFDREFRSSDGLTLHYLEAGAGERTIVFIPGWLMPAEVFRHQVEALAPRYRVLAFDPRSQGQSQVSGGAHTPALRTRDIDELLAAAQVGDFVLAGWSLGVLESLDYIEKYKPARLRGLMLIDNSIGAGKPPTSRSPHFFEKLMDPVGRTDFLKEFCTGLFRNPPPAGLLETVQASALRVPPGAARQTISQPYPRSYWHDIVWRQQVPILYAITPRYRDQGEELAAARPQLANVMVFENAGHALFVDEPERFDAAAEALMQKAFGD